VVELMSGYISEQNIKDNIGEAFPVFLRWHKGRTVVLKDGKTWYPLSDYDLWLDGENATP